MPARIKARRQFPILRQALIKHREKRLTGSRVPHNLSSGTTAQARFNIKWDLPSGRRYGNGDADGPVPHRLRKGRLKNSFRRKREGIVNPALQVIRLAAPRTARVGKENAHWKA